MAEAGSKQVMGAIASNLRSFIRARVRESELDDVTQEVYLRMQRATADLRDPRRLEAWMYRVARNAIVDQYRTRARRACWEELTHEVADESEADAAYVVERELAACVRPFVAALPPPYREALTLSELDGLKLSESAERLGLTLSAMKSRVRRGRAMLKEAFARCCNITVDARGRAIEYAPREHASRECELVRGRP